MRQGIGRKGTREAVAETLRRPRIEVIPLEGVEEQVLEHVPKGVKVTVTASPSKGLDPTLALAERLSGAGYETAPHLSARLVRGGGHLGEILARLRDSGIRDAFVVAGDAKEPAGPFAGARDLLVAMSETGHGLEEVGISGYPESHPFISDEETIRAMDEKEPYATYIVSQICFDVRTIESWVRRVRRRGVWLPIFVGMPGVVSRQKLLRISSSIGLGESARFLGKHRSRLARLFLPGGYSPDRLVDGLTPLLADPEAGVRGFHLYTFNEVAKTEAWRREKLKKLAGAGSS